MRTSFIISLVVTFNERMMASGAELSQNYDAIYLICIIYILLLLNDLIRKVMHNLGVQTYLTHELFIF